MRFFNFFCRSVLQLALIMAMSMVISATKNALAQSPLTLSITNNSMGSMSLSNYALGEGGLSSQVLLDQESQAPWIRTHVYNDLHPATVRVFIQEYYRIYNGNGSYNWSNLDSFVNAASNNGAIPLIASIDIKPAALFPGSCATTDTCVFPTGENGWASWQSVIEQLVRRYSGTIRYWEVSNEPDLGESGGCPFHFQNTSDYNTFYYYTANAIRAADSTAKVGGPVVSNPYAQGNDGPTYIESLISYSNNNGVPLDFISWHDYSGDPWNHTGPAIDWVKGRSGFNGRETLISEWNFGFSSPENGQVPYGLQPARIIATTRIFLEHGLSRSAYYHILDHEVSASDFDSFMSPGGVQNMENAWNGENPPPYLGIWADVNDPYNAGGYATRPSYYVFANLLNTVNGGTRVQVQGEQNVGALASTSGSSLNAIIYSEDSSTSYNLTLNLPSAYNWTLQKLYTDPSYYSNPLQQVGSGSGCSFNIASGSNGGPMPTYGIYLLTATTNGGSCSGGGGGSNVLANPSWSSGMTSWSTWIGSGSSQDAQVQSGSGYNGDPDFLVMGSAGDSYHLATSQTVKGLASGHTFTASVYAKAGGGGSSAYLVVVDPNDPNQTPICTTATVASGSWTQYSCQGTVPSDGDLWYILNSGYSSPGNQYYWDNASLTVN